MNPVTMRHSPDCAIFDGPLVVKDCDCQARTMIATIDTDRAVSPEASLWGRMRGLIASWAVMAGG